MIKQTLTVITSFFVFHYYLLRKNKKKLWEIAGNPARITSAAVTPLLLMVASIFFMPSLEVVALYYFMFGIPLVISNMVLCYNVIAQKQIYEAKVAEAHRRKEREKRQREQEDRLRREHEEMLRYFSRLREEHRRQYEYKKQKARDEYNKQTKARRSNTNNRANAINLMGLSENFTDKELKSAYRKLSKVHHPDVGGTQENFVRLQKAYDYLRGA